MQDRESEEPGSEETTRERTGPLVMEAGVSDEDGLVRRWRGDAEFKKSASESDEGDEGAAVGGER